MSLIWILLLVGDLICGSELFEPIVIWEFIFDDDDDERETGEERMLEKTRADRRCCGARSR